MGLVEAGPDVDGSLLALQDLQSEALRGVIRNMTMHQPGSWVVCFECNHRGAGVGEENDVAARGIVEREGELIPG